MTNFIIIPEGLSIDTKDRVVVSFVYRQVIDHLCKIISPGDELYFAPANNFGTNYYEQELGITYFKKIISNYKDYQLFTCKTYNKNYVDTLGNAVLLLHKYPHLKNCTTELVCSEIHSKRSYLCFNMTGYKIEKVHKVKITIQNEKRVKRLWYYKYYNVHSLYEKFAYVMDLIRLKILI